MPQYDMLDRTVVDDWNKLRAFFAEQYIYAHVNRPELLELAAKFKGSRPTLTRRGYGPAKFGEVAVPRHWRGQMMFRAMGHSDPMSGWPLPFRPGFAWSSSPPCFEGLTPGLPQTENTPPRPPTTRPLTAFGAVRAMYPGHRSGLGRLGPFVVEWRGALRADYNLFRDWATDKTEYTTAERCLDHLIGNSAAKSYDRSDRLEVSQADYGSVGVIRDRRRACHSLAALERPHAARLTQWSASRSPKPPSTRSCATLPPGG